MSQSEVEKASTATPQLDCSEANDQQISKKTESATENIDRTRQILSEKCEKAWEEWRQLSDDEFIYDLPEKKKGLLVIFSIETFEKEMHLEKRVGTEKDANNLTNTFKGIGFEPIVHRDATAYQFRKECNAIVEREDLKDFGCLAVAILTHWKKADYFYASDGEIQIDTISKYFECPDLVGKPKLFFIQACRGRDIDSESGYENTDAEPTTEIPLPRPIRLPKKSDFVYAYSTAPGYMSCRHPDGSWFIRVLCWCIERYAQKMDFVSIMTRVCSGVGHLPLYAEKAGKFDDVKQIPSFVSQLSKYLYFYPKQTHPAVQEAVMDSSSDSPRGPPSTLDVMSADKKSTPV